MTADGARGSHDADAAVVVVNYASHRLLERHLVGLDAAAVPARVVVVDNFSTDDERRAVTRVCERHGWLLVPTARNVGFGEGANRGVSAAERVGCKRFLLVNPDLDVDAPTARALLEHVAADPAALVGPVVVRPDGRVWSRTRMVDPRTGDSRPAVDDGSVEGTWLSGACLAVHGRTWFRLGGFDPDYFMYWEDVDLAHRALADGSRLVLRDDLQVVHAVGGTQGGKAHLYYYYNTRNRMLFAAKNLSGVTVARWLVGSPAASWRILLRGGRRQLLRRGSPLGAAARGTLVGGGYAVAAVLMRGGRRPAAHAAPVVGAAP